MHDQNRPDPLRSPLLDRFAAAGIRHGYFTRIGGVSDGIYGGLNIGHRLDRRSGAGRAKIAAVSRTGWASRPNAC